MIKPELRILDLIVYSIAKNYYDKTLVFAIKIFLIILYCALIQNPNHQFFFGFMIFIATYQPIEIILFTFSLILNILLVNLIENKKTKCYTTIIVNIFSILLLVRFDKYLGIKMKELGSIAMEFMFLLVKMYYISTNDRLSIFKTLNYIFLIPSLAAGPVLDLKFIETKSIITFKKMIKRIFRVIIFMVIFFQSDKFLISKNLNKGNHKFSLKVFILYLFGLNLRAKFYFTWEISSLCYLLNGYDVVNYRLSYIEFPISLTECIRNWNIWIYFWLKEAFFDPLSKYSFFLAALVTFCSSAFWHGGKDSDFLTAFFFCIAFPILRKNNIAFNYIFSSRVANGFNTIQTLFFISYLPIPFYFNTLNETMIVYRRYYFCGHVYLIISALIQLYLYLINYMLRINLFKQKKDTLDQYFIEDNPFNILNELNVK